MVQWGVMENIFIAKIELFERELGWHYKKKSLPAARRLKSHSKHGLEKADRR